MAIKRLAQACNGPEVLLILHGCMLMLSRQVESKSLLSALPTLSSQQHGFTAQSRPPHHCPVMQIEGDEAGSRLLRILITWLAAVSKQVHESNSSSMKPSTIAVKLQASKRKPGAW